jgi:hypothetical protein
LQWGRLSLASALAVLRPACEFVSLAARAILLLSPIKHHWRFDFAEETSEQFDV